MRDIEEALRSERGVSDQLRNNQDEMTKSVSEQQEHIGVLTEERDNAREKEEEYWQRLQVTQRLGAPLYWVSSCHHSVSMLLMYALVVEDF